MRVLVDVVVPARDEEDRIAGCLHGLLDAVAALARERPADTVRITLVLDACRDRTAAIATEVLAGVPDAVVLPTDLHAVGAARAAGIADAALRPDPAATDRADPSAAGRASRRSASRRDGTGDPAVRWIATTDADSVVPPGWLVQQADACRAGADVLVGGVVPDPTDLDPEVLTRWRASHTGQEALGHVHGANLGIRGDAYERLGGFEPVAEHEDVGLVARARDAGLAVHATLEQPVVTSGRLAGRTPGGYAEHLRATYTGSVPVVGLP